MGGTKGTHLFVRQSTSLPDRAMYCEAKQDGRPFFLVPWNGLLMVGTTDTRFSGDLDDVQATAADVTYLLAEANLLFPGARSDTGGRAVHLFRGPAVARRFRHIRRWDHPETLRGTPFPEASGLYSVVGGKLTNHRSLAEDVVDAVMSDLDRSSPRAQEMLHFRGIHRMGPDVLRWNWLSSGRIEPPVADRFAHLYGTRSEQVLTLAANDPALASRLAMRKHRRGGSPLCNQGRNGNLVHRPALPPVDAGLPRGSRSGVDRVDGRAS